MNLAPRLSTCSLAAGRTSVAVTTAPSRRAVAIACRPATPAPMTNTLAPGRRTLSTTSASLTASLTIAAPAAVYSPSGKPALTPAPGSTTTSAPSVIIFRTVSGVAATRSSAESVSRATAMRITPSPWELDAVALSTGCREGEREQRDHHHHDARRPRPAGKPMRGHDRREQEDDRQRDAPAAG